MGIPERRQNLAVSSRRGLIQPQRPTTAMIAGKSVSAARNATATPIAEDTPTVENTPIRAKLIARNVMPMVAAEAVITLPTEVNA
jgi:hypothetical protein